MDKKARLHRLVAWSPPNWSGYDQIANTPDPMPFYTSEVRHCGECGTKLAGYNPNERLCFCHQKGTTLIDGHPVEDDTRSLQVQSIIAAVCDFYKTSIDMLADATKDGLRVRKVLAYLLKLDAKLDYAEIALIVCRDRTVVQKWFKDMDLLSLSSEILILREHYMNKNFVMH